MSEAVPADPQEVVESMRQLVNSIEWHRSGGYARQSDSFQVGRHEYIRRHEQPEAWNRLVELYKVAPKRVGEYGGYKYNYVDIDDYCYWWIPSFGPIFNRALISLAPAPKHE